MSRRRRTKSSTKAKLIVVDAVLIALGILIAPPIAAATIGIWKKKL